jgi:hypothetical protein
VKKLFLVFLVLLVGMAGLSAAPPGEGWADDAPQPVMLQEGSAASIASPGVQADVELIYRRADQYRQGLLTQDEFKVPAAGWIDVLKIGTGGMWPLAEKTKQKVDRFFAYRGTAAGDAWICKPGPGCGDILVNLEDL